jgi:hypothetical protein
MTIAEGVDKRQSRDILTSFTLIRSASKEAVSFTLALLRLGDSDHEGSANHTNDTLGFAGVAQW